MQIMYNMLKNRLKSYADIFYMLYFLPLSGCVAMGISSAHWFYRIVFIGAAFFLLLKLFVTDYSKMECLLMLVTMLLLGYVFFRTGEKALIITVLSIFGCKDVCVRNVLRYTFFVYVIGMSITISLALLGIVSGEVHHLVKSGIPYKIYDFGFSHPNSAYSHILMIALMMVVVWQDKLHWYHYTAMSVIMLICYRVFLSRTGILIYVVLCTVLVLCHILKQKKLKKNFFFLWNFLPIGIFIISYILMIGFPDNTKVNAFLTGRVYLSYKAFEMTGLSWFGAVQREWISQYFIDNAYLNILLSCGISVCLMCLISYSLMCYAYWREEQYYVLIILGIVAVYAFMEYAVINVTWNPLLLFMSGSLFHSIGKEKV